MDLHIIPQDVMVADVFLEEVNTRFQKRWLVESAYNKRWDPMASWVRCT